MVKDAMEYIYWKLLPYIKHRNVYFYCSNWKDDFQTLVWDSLILRPYQPQC